MVPLVRPKPIAPGAQTARVVGLPSAANTVTRDHQVRIQFAWQRGLAPTYGGASEAGSSAHPDGHAPGNETSGTWVRVAEWLAGPNWGSHALPRIGAEVLVEFLHADIDQPLITGQLFNGEVAPPFTAGQESPANHIGTLSGLHTQSLDGSGRQQWVIDDAPGQLRQRLHTTLADSRLELGYLIQHNDGQRGALSGQGFDLATLGWGNLHAAQGVLLSTTARSEARSTQFDITEAVSQLKGAQKTAQALNDAASQNQVPALQGNKQQTDFITAVDAEQRGKYDGDVAGQPASKPGASSRHGGAPVERFAGPMLVAESPDSIGAVTPASALAYAGGHSHITVQDDAHFAAGHTFAAVSGAHSALFAQQGPVRAIAAQGPLSVQAHVGTLELLADQSVTVTATDERIDVLAKQKIVLQAGQSQVTLEGGNITFECPGNFTVKAGMHPFKGGKSNAAKLDRLPMAQAGDPMLMRAEILRTPQETSAAPAAKAKVPASLSSEQAAPAPGTGGSPAGIGSASPAPTASGNPVQYVNIDTANAKWNDGTLLTSLDAQTRKPKLRVNFNKAGSFPFKVKLVPATTNSVYSTTEQGRNTKYAYTTVERSYTTAADGTYVVDDFELAAGGKDEYTFEVRDDKNTVLITQKIETRRRVYLQQIKMQPPVEALAAANVNALVNEFANHGIEVLTAHTPSVSMPLMENVAPGADQTTLINNAKSAYASSQGP
ncbi:MAG: DUF2345 domain-containing protein, partial [Lysobacter sp.]|nr:DUF2345 domain-containing protein [Lysobacter sp.]